MGKQITFKLKEINTKETINTKTEEDEEKKSFKYVDTLCEITISVKGEENASKLGLPTESLDDSILVEFGPKQIQSKITEHIPGNSFLDDVAANEDYLSKELSSEGVDASVKVTKDKKKGRGRPKKKQ